MKKLTSLTKKLTGLLVLTLALTITLPPTTPPDSTPPAPTEDNETTGDENNGKAGEQDGIGSGENGSETSPCSDLNDPPINTLS